MPTGEQQQVFTYFGEENDYEPADSFRIDSIGIRRLRHPLFKWQDVQVIRAWVTTGDGDWGFDQFEHMELVYANGKKIHATDANYPHQAMLLEALKQCLPLFVPGLRPDWREYIWADYRLHSRRQALLNSFWNSWYPGKPLIYSRQ